MTVHTTDHLVPLPGSSWALWRTVGLRSAGIPVSAVTTLADAEVAHAADSAGTPQEFSPAYARAWQVASGTLAGIASDSRFREALSWQNPQLLGHGVDQVAGNIDFAGRVPKVRDRKRMMTVASYAQRYAAKNDTIGFFGPVGWARLEPQDEALKLRVGAGRLARRTVYFECWAMAELARRIEELPGLAEHLPLRRSPAIALNEHAVVTPSGRTVLLPVGEAALLAASDGARALGDVVTQLCADGAHLEAEVRESIAAMRERGWLTAALPIPPSSHPELVLRSHLLGLPGSPARSTALSMVDELVRARDDLAAAAGDADAVREGMDKLNAVFQHLTGVSADRRAGQMYAGRRPVYEDTVRDIEVTLGTPVLELLADPLDLLLTSVRWLTTQIGDAYEQRFRELYERLNVRLGGTVPLARLVGAATPDLVFSFQHLPPPARRCAEELRSKWQSILRPPPGAAVHQVHTADIRAEVLRAFPAAPLRWSGAVRHAPDLMLCAASAEALERGDFYAVLGELHVAANTLEPRVFVAQSADPEALLAAEAADHAGRRVVALPSASSAGVNSRTYPSAMYTAEDYTYWTMYDEVVDHRLPTLPAADLVVRDQAGALTVVSERDGREIPLLEALGEQLSSVAMNSFGLGSAGEHSPRITLDKLVVARETWRFEAEQLSWAKVGDGGERFRAARAWRREHGLPEQCYYSLAVETKPLFVDFTSVVLVEVLSRCLGRARTAGVPGATVAFSEPAPRFDEAWLPDGEGNRYTSELRMVAVDRAADDSVAPSNAERK